MTLKVSIVGASGYVGGELLRLLLWHPAVQVAQATSGRNAGRYLHQVHPNLRGRAQMQFVHPDRLEPCDVLFLALPHGEGAKAIEHYTSLAPTIIDCSADFRLRDPATYTTWYGTPHPAPTWLERFVYGLPEVSREALRGAKFASGVGCNATATNLALLPLVRAGLIDQSKPVVVEVKVGSSEGGASSSDSSHHPERAGVVRSFAPVGHRHTAEVEQVTGLSNVHLSITSVELVRGALATAHAFAAQPISEKELWQAYRSFVKDQPFLRIVKERQGIYRFPEPKILAGSNFADLGFALDPASGRIVSICALDNLMKGASGSAVQCMNLMCGLEETLGLEFPGLHPV
ncbi:N-acetyl-gamma-glutamyl-phosphate reductase [Candidatus Viridilinea mediisalina]|uniref:Putative [LysW]-L-2-aminoadipate 6-phosphate reductase n=1 Tax=Candidatus Viridilinea mediisalina TaxID=2024553 RepID=A0A2A6RJZ4_9CHLR|nr:N-acetyl-gamma-glutamyl-phosphate reductase [Candidatus Viridilinea mediisalina]PDW03387.1 N-acetyl-gamma-glutamyl-phosphate reductase [Candidatus Viridilinea mediisalina]